MTCRSIGLLLATVTALLVGTASTAVAVSFLPFKDPGPAYSDRHPTWSPDGTQVAFTSNRGDGYRRAFIMRSDGEVAALTTPMLIGPSALHWASDGRTIAFLEQGIWDNDQIGFVNVAGGETSWLGTREAQTTVRDLDWASSGDRIVFTRSDRESCLPTCWKAADVYGIRPDGTDEINLTASPEDETWVSSSPDGSRIAFTRGGPVECNSRCERNANEDLWVMNADGGSQQRLTATPGSESAPAWSPDGSAIAFAREGSIYIVNADGSGERLIGPGTDFDWAPSGAELVAKAGAELLVYRLDGGAERRLAANLEQPASPDWSPDGTRIVFEAQHDIDVDGTPHTVVSMFVVNADGSNLTLLSQRQKVETRPRDQTAPDLEPQQQPVPRTESPGAVLPTIQSARIMLRLVKPRTLLVRVHSPAPLTGRHVNIQRLERGRWRGVKRVRLGPGSTSQFKLVLRRPVRLRAFMSASQAGPHYAAGTSRPLLVRP
jgi:Tol biopolymer transport system component